MSNLLSLAQAITRAGSAGNDPTFIDGGSTYTFSPSGIRTWLGATLNALPATTFSGLVTVPGGSTAVVKATTTFSNGAAAATATLTNAPVAGNPTKWIKIDDAGTVRYIPAW